MRPTPDTVSKRYIRLRFEEDEGRLSGASRLPVRKHKKGDV